MTESKQRRNTKKEIHSFVAQLYSAYSMGTGDSRTYTYDQYSTEYRGPFIEFVVAVCDLCGIPVDKATIVGYIKKYLKKKEIE